MIAFIQYPTFFTCWAVLNCTPLEIANFQFLKVITKNLFQSSAVVSHLCVDRLEPFFTWSFFMKNSLPLLKVLKPIRSSLCRRRMRSWRPDGQRHGKHL
jgi:hypothetical protein